MNPKMVFSATLLAAAMAAMPAAAATTAFHVEIDTTPLAGLTGYWAFDFFSGSKVVSNDLEITGFTTTSSLLTATSTGNVIGTLLAPSLKMVSTQFFTEFLQKTTFAAGTTSFNIAVTGNFDVDASPDSFALFILDGSLLLPVDTSDPTGADALLVIDLAPPIAPQIYTSTLAAVSVSAVPDASPAAMLCLGLAVLMWRRKTQPKARQVAKRS